MRPTNQFTSEQQRFFFPINAEVEHHESLDTSNVPAVIYISGRDHFIVIEKDGVEEACRPGWNYSNLPGGCEVKQVAGLREGIDRNRVSDILQSDEFAHIDRETNSYFPEHDDQIIVKLHETTYWRARDNDQVPPHGIFILPHDQQLPTADELGLREGSEASYEFIGFINNKDSLVIPNIVSAFPLRNIVDWCVANELSQNELEHKLLRHELSMHAPLLAMLNHQTEIATYLSNFDAKNGTHFLAETEPGDNREEFPELTEEQRKRYSFLLHTAHQFRIGERQ